MRQPFSWALGETSQGALVLTKPGNQVSVNQFSGGREDVANKNVGDLCYPGHPWSWLGEGGGSADASGLC